MNKPLAQGLLLAITLHAQSYLRHEAVWRLTVGRERFGHVVVISSQFLVPLHDLLHHFIGKSLRLRSKAAEANGARSNLGLSVLRPQPVPDGLKPVQVFWQAWETDVW